MTDTVQPFDFHGQQIRVITAGDGEPRFVLNDLCSVLEIANPRVVSSRIDPESKGVCQTDTPGGRQNVTVVDEAGMYEVVLRSDKPEAVEFRRWVTREVLPAIRRHGGYLTDQTVEQALTDPDTIIQLATNLKDERARRAELEAQAAVDAPKIDYHDKFIADDEDVITIEDWGRQWGLSRPEAFNLLTTRKVIFRKAITREFSNKAGQVIARNEYRPYSAYRGLFTLRPQHNAPRYHNGQVRQTLYVAAPGSYLLANTLRLPGTPGGEATA
ncbi:BRO family protein [Corynebacterium glyciniphilum]|uniref:BRO family protein n=1 Tax=Corynebacterium glyciniphilum TaxID=1404244 RepID=UPI00164263E2|nr:BRO family protein [Corynebacterium glyciniphilum]